MNGVDLLSSFACFICACVWEGIIANDGCVRRKLSRKREEEEEDVTAVPAKARLISQLSNQATVQSKHEAGMGVIEDMYKAKARG